MNDPFAVRFDQRNFRGAVAGKGFGHRLDQLVIVASRWSDCNPQGYRPQRIIQCACGGTKKKKSHGQHQQ